MRNLLFWVALGGGAWWLFGRRGLPTEISVKPHAPHYLQPSEDWRTHFLDPSGDWQNPFGEKGLFD